MNNNDFDAEAFDQMSSRKLAELARLGISIDEIEKFSRQLKPVVGYIGQFKEIDTKDVEPTSQITGLKNVMREDSEESSCSREELLACTELPVVHEQIKVKPAITS